MGMIDICVYAKIRKNVVMAKTKPTLEFCLYSLPFGIDFVQKLSLQAGHFQDQEKFIFFCPPNKQLINNKVNKLGLSSAKLRS